MIRRARSMLPSAWQLWDSITIDRNEPEEARAGDDHRCFAAKCSAEAWLAAGMLFVGPVLAAPESSLTFPDHRGQ